MEYRSAIANARALNASQIFDRVLRYCGSTPSGSPIKSTTAKSSWFAPTMYVRSHIGTNLRQRYSHVRAINNKRSTQWELLKLYTCADIPMDDACKMRYDHDLTSCLRRCALAHVAFNKESRTTHATPIVSQSALRAVGSPPVTHHNLSTFCYIALGGEVPEMACLKLKLLPQQTCNCDMQWLPPIVAKRRLYL